jgi:hypothetical protein
MITQYSICSYRKLKTEPTDWLTQPKSIPNKPNQIQLKPKPTKSNQALSNPMQLQPNPTQTNKI